MALAAIGALAIARPNDTVRADGFEPAIWIAAALEKRAEPRAMAAPLGANCALGQGCRWVLRAQCPSPMAGSAGNGTVLDP